MRIKDQKQQKENQKRGLAEKKTWSDRQEVRQTDRQTEEEFIKIHTIVLGVHVNNRAQAALKRR